jgi:hypothetical protein
VGRTVDAVMAGVNAAVDVGAERVARRADNHVAGLVGEVKHVFTGRGSRTPTAERPNVSVLDDTLDRQGLPPLVDEHSGEPLHYNNLTDKQLDSYLKRTYATVLRNGATERPVDRVASFTQFTRHGALVAAKAEAERHVNIYLRDGKWEDGFNPSADKLLRKSVLSRLKYMEQRAEKKFGKVINAANRQLHDQNLHVRPDMLFLKETAEELKRMATHDLQRQIVALEGGGWIPEPRRGSYRDRWTNRGQNAGSLSSPEDYKQAIGPRYGELQNFRIQGRAPDSAMADRWFEQAWKLWEADQARERAFKAGEIDEATNDRLGRQLASGIDSASEQGSSYLTDAERADWQTDGFLEQQRQSGEVVKSLVDRSQWTLRDFLQQVSLHEVSLMGRGPNAATQVAQLRDVKFVTPDNLSATPGSINDMIRSVNSRVHTVVPQNLYAPRPAHPNPDQLLVQDLERLGNVMGEAMKMASDRGWSPAIQGGANGWRPGTVVMDGIQVDDATGRRIGAAFEAVRRHAARIDDAVPSPGVPSDRDDFLAQVGRLEAYMDSVLTPHDPNHYVARGSGAIPPRAPMNVGAIAHTPSPSGASL